MRNQRWAARPSSLSSVLQTTCLKRCPRAAFPTASGHIPPCRATWRRGKAGNWKNRDRHFLQHRTQTYGLRLPRIRLDIIFYRKRPTVSFIRILTREKSRLSFTKQPNPISLYSVATLPSSSSQRAGLR